MNNLFLVVTLIVAALLHIFNLPNKIKLDTKEVVNLAALAVLVIWIVYRIVVAL